MSSTVPGYEIMETLYESERTRVYRAREKASGETVVVKISRSAPLRPEDLLHFRRDVEITSTLEGEEFAHIIKEEQVGQNIVVILEDSGGKSLDRMLKKPTFELEEFLEIAIATTVALGRLHEQGVVHKDVNPSNVVWNPDTGEVELIDFGLSTRLEREYTTAPPVQKLTGTYPYMSPEQTGRTNRYLDYRTDYYSLGVLFYELVTGRRPFESEDPAELIYSHLARRPSPPHQVRRDVPQQLSRIILKLMSKAAEDRYQSAAGLRSDLEECLRQLREEGRIEPFEPGRDDVRAGLRISQRLYGREEEVRWLHRRFEQARNGERVLSLICGAPGVGKSTLIRQLQTPVIESNSWFVTGKFESSRQDTPYSACSQAMSQLITVLLSRSDEEVSRWRAEVEEALKEDAGLMASVVPELEVLLDRSLSMEEQDLSKARHRFRNALRRFIRVFCGAEHPLVIFVDDLQWADEASLKLLHDMMTDKELSHLMVVGAFRDEELSAMDSLQVLIEELKESGVNLDSRVVPPLNLESVAELLADSLQCGVDEVWSLAEQVVRKASGNPLFVEQFVTQLHRRGLLWFDGDRGQWRWDLESIEATAATENVVDLLTERLRSLEEPTRDALRYASLLGTRFTLEMLVSVCQVPGGELYKRLQPAIEAGVLVPLVEPVVSQEEEHELIVENLAFAHDEVRSAASNLLKEGTRREAHLRVGRFLKPMIKEKTSTGVLFLVVEHLNYASELIDREEERLELAGFNLQAARVALGTQAAAQAIRLLEQAERSLPKDPWESYPSLIREILLYRAWAQSLLGHFDRARELILEGEARIDDRLEKVDFQVLLIQQLTLQAEYHQAIEVGKQALNALGCTIPFEEVVEAISAEAASIEERLGGKPAEEILEVPIQEDPYADAVLRILAALQPPTGIADPELFTLIGLRATSVTLDVGIRPESATGLTSYAMVLISMGCVERGVEVAELALEVARRFQNSSHLSQVMLMEGVFVYPWSTHLRESLSLLAEAEEAGLRSGNYPFAGYSRSFELVHSFDLGCELNQLRRRARESIEFGEELGHQSLVESGHGFDLVSSNLLGETSSPADFHNERFPSAEAFIDSAESRDSQVGKVVLQLARAQIRYLYGDSKSAARILSEIEGGLDALLGGFDLGRFYFYQALALIDVAAKRSKSDRSTEKKIEALRETLARYSANCPENFLHKVLLVDAERARLEGDMEGAMRLYDRAIEEARKQGFVHLEALANERAGLFWMEHKKAEFARGYLRAARYGYELWGASRKVEMLRERFGNLAGLPDRKAEGTTGNESSTGDPVDVISVFKASELIAGQLDVDALLPILMQVILENAGAQRGAFFIANDAELCVAAEGESDGEPVMVDPQLPLDQWNGPRSVVRYVKRTGEPVVLGRAFRDPRFQADPYIRANRVRSLLCIPAVEQDVLRGIVYVENNLGDDAFGEERMGVLQILADHIGIALNRADLYAELRERQERFRQLAENINEVFWLMDWPSGEITYVSPAFETVWARRTRALPISIEAWAQSVVSEDRQRVIEALHQKAATGEYDETYRIERPSGSMRWIRDRGFPIRDEEGKTYRIAGVAMDITREHEVAQLKEEFISVVSHELRTPLTPITGIFSMLVNNKADEIPEEIQHMAGLGLRNSRRLLALIDDLLDIQNLSMDRVVMDREILDFAEVVEEAVELNEALGEARDISITFTVDRRPILVKADRNRLLQVMTNLLSNAVKFSGDHEGIEVEARSVDGVARATVTDHGPGIPREARAQVFEKFTQADSSLTRKHGGTGLGLAIARTLVERLGGRIYFETEEDRGTTFVVELPILGSTIEGDPEPGEP